MGKGLWISPDRPPWFGRRPNQENPDSAPPRSPLEGDHHGSAPRRHRQHRASARAARLSCPQGDWGRRDRPAARRRLSGPYSRPRSEQGLAPDAELAEVVIDEHRHPRRPSR